MIVKSYRALAPFIGVSSGRLCQLLKAGKISREPDGAFDVEKVKLSLAQKCDQSQSRETSQRSQSPEEESQEIDGAEKKDSYSVFNRARAMKEVAVARQKQLDLKKRQGELVEVAAVEKEWGDIISSARTRLLLLPDKIAPKIAATKDVLECKAIIDHEIREIMRALTEQKTDAA